MKYFTFILFILLLSVGQGVNAMRNSSGEPIVGLNKEEKAYLLKLVRQTILTYLEKQEYPATEPISDKLKEEFGVFVTLHKHGQLRGCIGYVEGIKPLYQAVMDMARSAAFSDPRFPPVKLEEMKDLEIEISVLSPLKKIKDVNEIQVGKHGIIIQKGFQRGLLLPQVATEWHWNREEFLRQTCFKAGLPAEAWKDPGTEIMIFSAEIFNEKEILGH